MSAPVPGVKLTAEPLPMIAQSGAAFSLYKPGTALQMKIEAEVHRQARRENCNTVHPLDW
jgi:hypothetical protein